MAASSTATPATAVSVSGKLQEIADIGKKKRKRKAAKKLEMAGDVDAEVEVEFEGTPKRIKLSDAVDAACRRRPKFTDAEIEAAEAILEKEKVLSIHHRYAQNYWCLV